MRDIRRAVVGVWLVVAIAGTAPASAAVYRFRGTLNVEQTTTWQSLRDDVADGVRPTTCFGKESGSGTQRLSFSVPLVLAFTDAGAGRNRRLNLTAPRRFMSLTPTITRTGQLTFVPDPRSQCGPESARTDGCGTHHYRLLLIPGYDRLYGTSGRDREVIDVYNTLPPDPPPFNPRDPQDDPSCPYPNGNQLMPSWDGAEDFTLDEAWRVVRKYGNHSKFIGAQIHPQFLPASRIRNRGVSRTVTRHTFTLRQLFEDQTKYASPDGSISRILGRGAVTARTTATTTWTLRRAP